MTQGKVIKIGVMPQRKLRERTLAIARGDYKPGPDEPKLWFPSMRSLAEVLSDENQRLLHVIAEHQPQSIADLAATTGRKASNLSRTLKMLAGYGIVHLERVGYRRVRPVVECTDFQIETRIEVFA